MNTIQFKQLSQSIFKDLQNSRSERFLMRESANQVGPSPGSVIENQAFRIKHKNYGGSDMKKDISMLIILAKSQEQQCSLLALARYTQLPPLTLERLLNFQNIESVVCKLIYSHITLILPPKSANIMTRILTLKLEKRLARPKNSIIMQMKNKSEQYLKRQNMRDPMLNREYQAMLRITTYDVDDEKAQQDSANAEEID
ncbi:MAG: hypothetical protein EZS28_020651 [Streblomastix strix]|uniref:Uncharacterized protein n=1 Tax=Streblomastix strix TaxID=222440 RepID=A0A5J4VNI0_9EUKA|nr:MAG: hypothetical protein EZS28_020651 [Streblomastix strix]